MTLMDWSPALELEVKLIDEQHKMLLDTMNTLNDQILRGKGKQGCSLALQNMRNYTTFHFSDEEGLMRESQFPYLDRHKLLHQTFILETDKFSITDCEADPQKAMQVLSFLRDWMIDHILGPDLIFARYFKTWKASQE